MMDWTNDPKLAGIQTEKLKMLQSMAAMGIGKGPNELLPLLMEAAASSKQKGLQFNDNEIEQIITVLKMNRSPEETARIDRMLQMIRLMKR